MLQLQAKLWMAEFQPAELVKELKKRHCPETVPVLFCLVVTKLGVGLEACVLALGSRVLILTSWSDTYAAEFTVHQAQLLWHLKGQEKWY